MTTTLTLALAALLGAEPGMLDPMQTPSGLWRFEVERRVLRRRVEAGAREVVLQAP